jgi:hypothetical protein
MRNRQQLALLAASHLWDVPTEKAIAALARAQASTSESLTDERLVKRARGLL